MAMRLTYTTGSRSPELDSRAAFDGVLDHLATFARAGRARMAAPSHSERVAVLRATERLIENHKLFLAAMISRVWGQYEF